VTPGFVPKIVASTPAPELIGNLNFDSCLHAENLKAVCIFPHYQRRTFIFWALGYFKLGALLEGLRRLMSYKLALRVLARVAKSEVKYPTPTPTFPNSPTPVFKNFRLRPFQNFRLLSINGMKFGC